jgi:hypothetical protein
MRRHPPHHLGPARASTRQGKTPKRASAAPSHHSNAPIKHESQSFLSKKIAHPEANLGARSDDTLMITNSRRMFRGFQLKLGFGADVTRSTKRRVRELSAMCRWQPQMPKRYRPRLIARRLSKRIAEASAVTGFGEIRRRCTDLRHGALRRIGNRSRR